MSELEGLDGTVNVYVNGKEVEVFMGARVRDALMTYDQEAFSEHLQGEIRIEDQDGHRLSPQERVATGAQYFIDEK